MLVYFTLLMDHLMVLNLKSMFGSKRKLIWILIFQTPIKQPVTTAELLCLKNEWFELSKFEKINIMGAVLYLPQRVTMTGRHDSRTLGSSVWAKWQTFLHSWPQNISVYNFFKYRHSSIYPVNVGTHKNRGRENCVNRGYLKNRRKIE